MDQEDVGTGVAPESEAATTGGFSSRVGKAKDAVGEKYTAATDAVKTAYADTRAKATEGYKQVKTKVDDIDFDGLVEQGRAYVRSNPGKALLISVGVGFVIGLLLRRGDE